MRKFTKYPSGYIKASSDGIKYYEIEFANIDENSDVSDLDPDADEFYSICIRGRRKPSIKEAEEFCREDMVRSGNNIVVNVAELTPEEAHAFYDMGREDEFPVFG